MCMCHVPCEYKKVTRMTQSIHLNFFPIYFCSFSQHHQSYLFQNHFLPCSKLLFLLFFFCLPLLPTNVKQPHKKYFVIKEKKIAYQIVMERTWVRVRNVRLFRCSSSFSSTSGLGNKVRDVRSSILKFGELLELLEALF